MLRSYARQCQGWLVVPKANFHTSHQNSNNKPKIDPGRFKLPTPGHLDIESIRHFKKLEEKYNKIVEKNPELKGELSQESQQMWDKLQNEDPLFQRLSIPHPINLGRNHEKPETLQNLDVDSRDGFAKAMNYLSNEQTLNPEDQEDEAEDEDDEGERYPVKEILSVGRHTQITAGGRVYSFSALMLMGTGKGCAGLGYARGNSVAEAVLLAKKKAVRNMMAIDLWRGNHIGADIKVKYKKSWVFMVPRKPGNGRSCGYEMGILLDAFGVNDLTMGHGGARNKNTLYRAVFLALRDHVRSPEKVARMTGRKLFNRAALFYNSTQ